MNRRYALVEEQTQLTKGFIEVEETMAAQQEQAMQALYPGTYFKLVDPMTPTANYWVGPDGVLVNVDPPGDNL